MKDCVLIKGNQYGLSVMINEDSTFQEIKSELQEKLKSARAFFGANKVTLSFSGKSLLNEEQDELVQVFQNNSDLDILCIVDKSNDMINLRKTITDQVRQEVASDVTREVERRYVTELQELQEDNQRLGNEIKALKDSKDSSLSLQQEDKVTFHNATLRSGQQVVVNHSVVVMGDVNNGARVEAKGNVIILGKLKGVVHAGLRGSNNAYIIALDMKPVQLRINEAFGRAPDEMMKESSDNEPKIAFVHEGMIAIERIDNKVLKEIRDLN